MIFCRGLLQLFEQIFFQHAGVQRGFVGGVGKDVPGAEDEIVEIRERHEILDLGTTIVGAFAETDRAHLRQAADRLRQAFFNCFDAGDECRADRAEADQQHAELTFCRRDFRAFLYRHYLEFPPNEIRQINKRTMIHEERENRTLGASMSEFEGVRVPTLVGRFIQPNKMPD